MNLAEFYDSGAFIHGVVGMRPQTVNACTTQGNADPVFGATVDRLALNRRYRSAKVLHLLVGDLVQATSTHGITLSATPGVQHSSDGSSWDAFSTGTVPSATIIGATVSATATGPMAVAEQRVNLNGARRYIRQVGNFQFGGSSTTQDGVMVAGAWVFGGGEEQPTSS